jgi:hypothetical protein
LWDLTGGATMVNMTVKNIQKDITKRLFEKEIIVNNIQINGFNKIDKTIKSIQVSLDDIDSGYNILYTIKTVLDDLESEYGFSTLQRLIEF